MKLCLECKCFFNIRYFVLKFVPEYGYNLGTPALKPYKREIKTHQNDTIL